MARSFYNANDILFKDFLWTDYIFPAINWFADNENNCDNTFLLPKSSGSIWECALSVDFVLRSINDHMFGDIALKLDYQNRCLNTIKWMLDSIPDNGNNWEEAQWDTAITIFVIVKHIELIDDNCSKDEKHNYYDRIQKVIDWLVSRISYWQSDDARYMAGLSDLSQVLLTLISVQDKFSNYYLQIEKRHSSGNDAYNIIDSACRILLQMASKINATYYNGKEVVTEELICWGDIADSAAILHALTKYYNWKSEGILAGQQKDNANLLDKLSICIVKALRFIEVNQAEGHWGSVANSVVTFHNYMCTVGANKHFDFQDQVVFKALRWVCDCNQTLTDGSLLHSSYVTSFYALSLYEAYSTWDLSNQKISYVYDFTLWLAPNASSEERTRRLMLELQLRDSQQDQENIVDLYSGLRALISTLVLCCSIILISLFLSCTTKFIQIDLSGFLTVNDWSGFLTVLGVIITLLIAIAAPVYNFKKKRVEKKCCSIKNHPVNERHKLI